MAESRTITKELLGLEDILTGEGTVNQTRGGSSIPITKLNASNLQYNATETIKDVLGKKATVLANVAAMQALVTVNGQTEYAFLRGYDVSGDSGGGLFWLDTSDVVSVEDLISIFNPDVVANGRWKRVDLGRSMSADNGDANLVIAAGDEGIQLFGTALTANRTVALPTANLFKGLRYTIFYTTASAFTLAIGSVYTFGIGDAGTIEIQYDGAAWTILSLHTDKPIQYKGTAGGTVDALTVSVGMKAYDDGDIIFLRSLGDNTVIAPTINIDGLGLKTIVKDGNSSLFANDLGPAGRELILAYNSAIGKVELLTPFNDDAGDIITWPLATAKVGTLECDGSAISRTTYADLFAVISTLYGVGDGSTTFNIPNFQGEFLRGWDNAAGVDPDAAGRTDRGDGTGGDVIGSKQATQNLTHNHLSGQQFEFGGLYGDVAQSARNGAATVRSNTTSSYSSSSGGNQSNPTNVNVMYCIKY